MTLVIDASALVDALLPTENRVGVLAALDGADLCAPQILDGEVLSAVARLERASQISAAEGNQAVRDLLSLSVTRMDSEALLEDVWRGRHGVRVSDGFYLAAARLLGCPLLTTDARLARAPVRGVTVTLVG